MPSPTDGYQVGNAFIQMLPSFRAFHKKIAAEMAGIGDVHVQVEPEVSTKKAAAAVAEMDKRLSKTPITKKVEIDERAFNAQMALITAKRDALLLRIDADISGLNARIAEWERKRGNTKINVDAEIAKAEAKIRQLEAQRDVVYVQVDVDADKAEQKLNQVERQLNRLANNQHDINMEASDASRVIAVIGLLTAGLAVVGQVAPAAAAAVATVPTALLAAAQGVSAVIAGLSGISDATKALQAVEDQAVIKSSQGAQQRVASTNRVAAAQSALERALEQADRSAIQGARQVQAAREALADAQVTAVRRVQDAERALTAAQQSARDAQEALTRARKDATENLEDLRLALSGAALDEESAVLAVERAQERLNAARAAGVSGLDLAEVELGARQAEQALAEIRDRYGDLREEADEATQAGVDGSRLVVSAQRDAGDATQRLSDAERDLTDARTQGARDVAKAQERVAEAQQQASWAAADASRAIADAQRAIADATTATGAAGTAAMDKLTLSMSKLTPAGQEFAKFLKSDVQPALHAITGATQGTFLPRLEVALNQLLILVPEVADAFSETGRVLGDVAIQGADMVTSGPWRADFATIMSRNNRMLGSLGDAGLSALDALRNLTIASGPLTEALFASAEGYTAQFAAWIQGKRDTGELQVWFQEMSVRIREVFETIGQLTGGIWNLLQALSPLGRIIMDIVGPLVQWIGAMAEANPVLTTVIAVAVLASSTFVSFFRTLGGLKQAFSTSTGVYRGIRDSIIGVKNAADDATTATTKNADATQAMGLTADRSGGLVGKLRTSLDSVGAAYRRGSDAASLFALRASTAVNDVSQSLTSRLLPATTGSVRALDDIPSTLDRVTGGFTTFSTTAQLAMSNVAGKVGGTAAAITKGLGGAMTGIMGALGGPFGLALIGATVGLGLLADSQAEAAEEAARHKAQIQSLTDALVESGGAIDDNVRKQIRLNLEERKVADNASHLGVNLGTMIRAIGEGGTAAQSFEKDLMGLARQLTVGKGLAQDDAVFLQGMAREILATGGSARDFSGDLNALATEWQRQTGASDEARDAYQTQLTEYLDLIGGYRGSKGDFDTAEQQQRDIADAQGDAASETERHTRALKALQDRILGAIDKDLAYRQSLQALEEAQTRVANASAEDMPAALLAQEQAMLDVITRAGELAYSNSKATDETGKLRDSVMAQAQAAVDLANKFSGPLPTSLQQYLDKLGIAKTATGEYKIDLDSIPPEVLTNARFDDAEARGKIIAFYEFMHGQISAGELLLSAGLEVTPANIRAALQEKKGFALGAIAVPAYANGAVRSMSARTARIVPPNSPRLIGDRMRGDEGFIPINTEPRSLAILAEVAARMGFGLVPLALGGVLAMQSGGVAQSGTPAASAGTEAALTVNVPTVDAFTAAVQTLLTAALTPLAAEVTATTVPALMTLEEHAGVRAVASIVALAELLPPLRNAFEVTAAAIGAAWLASTHASQTGVNAISGQLTTLRQGIQQTGTVFSSTADLIKAVWSRVPAYTADPVRAALSGPYNSGLIPAWNYLNQFFALNRPLSPIAIPFAVGGLVPGVGNEDTVPAMLMPGEYVISKPVVKKWGLANIHTAHMAAQRGGFPGLEGMLTGDEGGIFRVGFASGGPVPEALARATAFGRSMHGKPYIWGGSSEAGTDCSGWMAMLARALLDVKPYARREWATAAASGGNPPPRFARGIEGLFAIGVNPGVHTAGTLAGMNVESGGAHNYVAFGPPSTGADDPQFPLKFHLPELGGKFVSGGTGGAFNLATFIRESFNATHEQLAQFQDAWGANMLAQAGAALTGQAADAIVNHAINTITPMGVTGDVESWRPLVLQALRMLGLPLEWADITLRRMNQESGGNQFAVNNWDSNAKRGDPSKGLMQVIGSTFSAYRDTRAPDNVFDPLANLLSSMKYCMARYGSLPAGYGRAGGYDDGGYLPPGYSSVYNGLSRPEAVLTDNQWAAMYALATDSRTGGGDFRGNLYLSTGEFLGIVHGAINSANDESGRVLARRTR